jgi:hypothetical protein
VAAVVAVTTVVEVELEDY